MKDLFSIEVTAETIHRIEQLKSNSQPLWGKMNAAQMLAHCCVSFEMVYTNKFPKPGAIKKFFLRLIVKNSVTNEQPYPKSSRTAPEFLVAEKQDFNRQQERLIAFIKKVQNEGRKAHEGKEYPNFGKLSANEWNNLYYKHLDHHLTQFGV
ncbi:MAG: DUF1569 domain-containing protein [Bacteroidia bacterium]